MKKLFAVLLALLMVLTLAGCGAKEEKIMVVGGNNHEDIFFEAYYNKSRKDKNWWDNYQYVGYAGGYNQEEPGVYCGFVVIGKADDPKNNIHKGQMYIISARRHGWKEDGDWEFFTDCPFYLSEYGN